jgi:hypothetical protein
MLGVIIHMEYPHIIQPAVLWCVIGAVLFLDAIIEIVRGRGG